MSRPRARRPAAGYERRVFINCPFDQQYLPLLRAIAFAVIDCGFAPQIALQEVNGRLRLEKIIALMRDSRLSIHDISRLPATTGDLPRFNMPFECGLFVGMMHSGAARHRDKQFLVLDGSVYQYQRTMSDVSGLDPKTHDNDPLRAIDAIRHFLGSELRSLTKGRERAPGGAKIAERFGAFQRELPSAAARQSLTVDELLSIDYLVDLIALMSDWIAVNR